MNIFFGGMLFIAAILFVGCNNRVEEEMLFKQQQREFEIMIVYAGRSMRFNNQLGWGSSQWTIRNVAEREIILVRSEEEANALGLSLDTIIAWPSPYSLARMDAINQVDINLEVTARLLGKSIEELELTLPLTIDDIVFNWYNVYHLIMGEYQVKIVIL